MLYDFICLEEGSFLWRRSAVNFTHYITLIFGRECKSHQITEEITLRLFKMTIAKRAWRDISMFLNPFLTVRSFYFEYWKSCSRPAFLFENLKYIIDKQSSEVSLEKSRKKILNITVKHSNRNEWMYICPNCESRFPKLLQNWSSIRNQLVARRQTEILLSLLLAVW